MKFIFSLLLSVIVIVAYASPAATVVNQVPTSFPVAAIPMVAGQKIPANTFKVTEIYAKKGVSHFRDVLVPANRPFFPNSPNTSYYSTPPSIATSFLLTSFPGSYFWTKHNPPAGKRFLEIVLQGSETITAGDGTTRTFTAGDMVIYEDSTGSGHTGSGKNGTSVIIALN